MYRYFNIVNGLVKIRYVQGMVMCDRIFVMFVWGRGTPILGHGREVSR